MTRRALQIATLVLALVAASCGHKGPPLPPPLMHPAPARDLRIQQRGAELILEFTYPQTTAGGLPLTRIGKVEYWELVKPVAGAVGGADPEAEDDGAGLEPGDEVEAESGAAVDSGADRDTAETRGGEDEAAETAGGIDAGAASDDEEDAGEDPDEEADAEETDETEAPAPTAASGIPLPPPPTKEQAAAVELLEFAATARQRLVLEGEELAAAIIGDKIALRLPFAEPAEKETAYIYAVKTWSDARRVSTWSNLATLVRRQPPPAPERFAVEAEAGGVRVTWFSERAEERRQQAADGVPPPPPALPGTAPGEERADEVKSYRIYRRDAQARSYPPHVGQATPESDEYLDRTAQYGNRYIYSLTAVGLYTPLVESALAGEIEIDYQDRFAPPAPTNPIALAEPGRVRVLWDASPAPDLAGYIVFRRQPGAEDFTRLTVEPVLDLEYDDRGVAAGTRYEYRIAAVDRVGNQSEPSVTTGARTP